ncbi:MAG: hypothetical protein JOZ82_08910 [Marmoricola sp.]|nr:hypothetical protein [Marmoricola sp.]
MARTRTSTEPQAPSGHYTFVAPSPVRRVVMLTLMFTVLGLIYMGYQLTVKADDETIGTTIALALLAVAQWTFLQACIPQRIDIDKSVITINRSGTIKRYDLVDPGLEVRVRDGEIAFANYMEPWTVVKAREVTWSVFIDVLMHYQNRADINAELRDQRFQR